jgi:hypothetical protein
MKTINENAPIVSRKTITIEAKPEKIWRILSNIDEWPTWNNEITNAKLHGPLQPNVSFTWKSGRMKITSMLHTVAPYYSIGWTGKVLGIYAIHNWNLKVVDGFTEVMVSESMEGLLAKLFKKKLQPTLEKGMENWLELLKKESEKENGTGLENEKIINSA